MSHPTPSTDLESLSNAAKDFFNPQAVIDLQINVAAPKPRASACDLPVVYSLFYKGVQDEIPKLIRAIPTFELK